MNKAVLVLAAIALFAVPALSQKKEKIKLSKMDKEFLSAQPDGMYAKMETNRGDIYLMLEYKQTPLTVANFVGLAEGSQTNTAKPAGTPYYDGLIFHRIIPGFMIQGGCPKKNGSGDPGYSFDDELYPESELGKNGYKRGTLAMANRGPNTNGSQFFIMHKDYGLPYAYTIFGHVVKGIEAVDSIAATQRDGSDKPLQDQTIKKITILRKGKEAEAFDAPKVFEAEKVNIVKKAEEKEKNEMLATEKILKEKYGNAQTTASGLKYIIENPGTGAEPKVGDIVSVHYTGMLLDGKKFDSSVDRGQPIQIPIGVGQVIKGWDEGILLLKEGGKGKLVIPPYLGYGKQGAGGVIPPNAWLVFDVELVKVEAAQKKN
jgi:peptidyl-prolyl cis-trans isomerase A (cyclophilin A)